MPIYDTSNEEYNDYLEVRIMNCKYEFSNNDIEVFKKHNKIKFKILPLSNINNNDVWYGSLDNLPDNITHLELPYYYNEPIKKLPKNLKVLILGDYFNQILELPESLEEFICSKFSRFNQAIIYPPNTKIIKLGMYFNKNIDNLPFSLENLVIDSKFFNHSISNLPFNLKQLTIKNLKNINNNINFDYLPISLIDLFISYEIPTNISVNNLPSNLKKLELFNVIMQKDYEFLNLPNSLEQLIITSMHNVNLINLPTTLKLLSISAIYQFNITLDIDNLPNSLETLKLCDTTINTNNSLIIIDCLPINLKKFELCFTINYGVKDCKITLPDNLEFVKIHDYRQNISIVEIDKIPSSCEIFEINIKNQHNNNSRLIINNMCFQPKLNKIYTNYNKHPHLETLIKLNPHVTKINKQFNQSF